MNFKNNLINDVNENIKTNSIKKKFRSSEIQTKDNSYNIKFYLNINENDTKYRRNEKIKTITLLIIKI